MHLFIVSYCSEVKNVNTQNTPSSQYILSQKQLNMEQNTSDESSCCSSSNMFTVKVVIAWLIICLPGNIFALICIYGAEDNDIPSSHEKLSNFSVFTNFSLSSQQNYTNFHLNKKIIIRHLNLTAYLEEHDMKIQAVKLNVDLKSVSIFYIYDLLIV